MIPVLFAWSNTKKLVLRLDVLKTLRRDPVVDTVNCFQHYAHGDVPECLISDNGCSGMQCVVQSVGDPGYVTSYNALHPQDGHDTEGIDGIVCVALADNTCIWT